MDNKYASRFLIGALFGVMVGVIVWYWQKSTSAENGALALLDRLATAEARLRDLKAAPAALRPEVPAVEAPATSPVTTASDSGAPSDDLKQVKGIGSVFEARLRKAGIQTIEQLSDVSVSELAAILEVAEGRAEAILEEVA